MKIQIESAIVNFETETTITVGTLASIPRGAELSVVYPAPGMGYLAGQHIARADLARFLRRGGVAEVDSPEVPACLRLSRVAV
jgi:hypothetical protein